MASEYLNQMQRLQKKLNKKVSDVEKKKQEIKQMYQESLEQNLKVIKLLKERIKTATSQLD